ncbi:hypothetical protein HDV05_008282 [Chytridiales sp. JEL 0842]|nr:hypothetical protein HDV05_008282 [Chytridiales sp. JEL 0842]
MTPPNDDLHLLQRSFMPWDAAMTICKDTAPTTPLLSPRENPSGRCRTPMSGICFTINNTAPLLTLPPELQLTIYHALQDSISRFRLSQSCQHFYNLFLPLRWASPVIPTHPQTPLAPMLIRHGFHIKRLSFPDPTHLDLLSVAPHLPNLQHLDLSGMAPFTVQDVHVLALFGSIASPQNISVINLNDCIEITDRALVAIANYGNAKNIHTVSLDRCCEVTDVGLISLVRSLPKLKHLSANLIPLASTSFVKAVSECCSELEYFGAADADFITDESLLWLANGCHKLKSLDISNCNLVTEAGLIQFQKKRIEIASQERQAFRYPVATPCQDAQNTTFETLRVNALDAITDRSFNALMPQTRNSIQRHSVLELNFKNFSNIVCLELANMANLSPRCLEHLAAHGPRKLKTLNLSQTSFLPALPNTNVNIQALESLNNLLCGLCSLSELNLSGGLGGIVNDDVCKGIAKGPGTSLKTLDLSDCEQITDVGLQEISAMCTNLEDLNLKACSLITDNSITSFFDRTCCPSNIKILQPPKPPTLRFLNVGLCNKLTDSCVEKISKYCSSRPSQKYAGMHTLKLSGCFKITDSSLNSMICTSTASPTNKSDLSLRLLCLSGCYQITSTALQTLLPRIPLLESINLYSCTLITDDSLTCLAQNCPNLVSLVISKCPITDLGAASLGKYCGKLHTLYMSFLVQVRSGTKTTEMESGLSGTWVTDEGVRRILEGCKQLKLLDLSRCEALTDAAFLAPVQNADSMQIDNETEEEEKLALQVLMVRICPRLTFEGLKRLVGRCPRLQNLDVVGCSSLTLAEREELGTLVSMN